MKSIEILVCLWSELFDVTGACCYWWSLQGGKLEGIGPKFPDPLNHFRVFFVVVLSKGVKTKHFHPKFPLPKNSGVSISMHICASEHFVPGGRCGVGNDKEVEFQTGRCLSGAWTSSFQAQVTRVCLKTHLSYFHLSMQSQTSFVNVFEMFGLSWNLPFWRWTNMVGYVAGYFFTFRCRSRRSRPRETFDGQVLLELPSYHDQRWSDEATAEVAICIHSKCKSPRLHVIFLWPRREKGKLRDFKTYYCRFDSRIDSWNKILLDPSVPLGFWRIWIQFNSYV